MDAQFVFHRRDENLLKRRHHRFQLERPAEERKLHALLKCAGRQELFLLFEFRQVLADPFGAAFDKLENRPERRQSRGAHDHGATGPQDDGNGTTEGLSLHLDGPSPIFDALVGDHGPENALREGMSQKNAQVSFYQLDPEAVMSAAEDAGFEPTGEFTQLNSYENRVFDVSLEDRSHVIAKFYRPGRWSRETILEEHEFLLDLQAEGIHAVAPLPQKNGVTLSSQGGLWTAFFPKVRGRLPDELLDADLVKVGRLLARVHNVGARRTARHRPVFDTSYHGGWPTLDRLEDWIAPEVKSRYVDAAEHILEVIDETFDPSRFSRIHGDCHRGNLLNNGQEFFLIDFDDFVIGPAVQDFWMLLSGDTETLAREQDLLLEGYSELREFPEEQWDWIPLLRGLRILMYSGWIAQRWEDPSFPRLFPDFETYSYWAKETEALEKIAWSI